MRVLTKRVSSELTNMQGEFFYYYLIIFLLINIGRKMHEQDPFVTLKLNET